jgi:methyl-accepting chemotaxis protein
MPHPTTNTANTPNPGYLSRLATRIRTYLGRFFSWLSLGKMEYPPDEAGELMRRYMAKKSWFDTISGWWCERSFFTKTVIITGLTLVAAGIGFLIGAVLGLTLSTAILSFIAHKLLMSHEHHRREKGKIIVAEAVALTVELKASQDFFKKATIDVRAAAEELQASSKEMKEQAHRITVETEAVHQANEGLLPLVDEIKTGTATLLEHEAEATAHLETMAGDLRGTALAISHTTERVEAVTIAAEGFSTTVLGMQQSERVFSEAVSRFRLFVATGAKAAPLDPNVIAEEDEFLALLKRQNDEDEALIAQMRGGALTH